MEKTIQPGKISRKLNTEDYEREYCKQLIADYRESHDHLTAITARLTDTAERLRAYGAVVAKRNGERGDWVLFNPETVIPLSEAVKFGVPAALFPDAFEPEEGVM